MAFHDEAKCLTFVVRSHSHSSGTFTINITQRSQQRTGQQLGGDRGRFKDMVENVRKRFGGRLCPKLCHFWLAAVVAVRSGNC